MCPKLLVDVDETRNWYKGRFCFQPGRPGRSWKPRRVWQLAVTNGNKTSPRVCVCVPERSQNTVWKLLWYLQVEVKLPGGKGEVVSSRSQQHIHAAAEGAARGILVLT